MSEPDRTSEEEVRGREEIPLYRRPLYVALAVVLAGVLALQGYGFVTTSRLLDLHAPLLDAIEHIQVQAVFGHLGLEELLYEDREGSLDRVWEHFDEADQYLSALLEGQPGPRGLIRPIVNEEGRAHVQTAKAMVAELRTRAQERVDAWRAGARTAAADETYHRTFQELLAETDSTEAILEDTLDREARLFRNTYLVLFLFTAAALLLGSVGFLRLERRRTVMVRHLRQARKEAQVNEARFRRLVENSADAIFLSDSEGRIIDANSRAWTSLGYSREELLGLHIRDIEAQATPKEIAQDYRKLDAGARLRLERTLRRKDGSTFPVEVHAQALDWGDRRLILGIARDVTLQKEAQEALRRAHEELEERVRERTADLQAAVEDLGREIEVRHRVEEDLRYSEQKYSTLVESSPTGIFIFRDGRIVFANRRLAEISGYSVEEILDTDLSHLIHPDDYPWAMQMAQQRLAGEEVPSDYEVRGITKSGELRWLNVRATVVEYRGGPSILGNLLDITPRKRMEEALSVSEERLRALSTQLLNAQEEERARIARDLHDSIGQALSAIKFGVETALRSCTGDPPKPSVEILESVVPRLQDAVEEVRRISMDLRPSIIDDLGLPATISWHCREFQALHPEVDVERNIEVRDDEIPEDLKIVIFRIVQEAMGNAVRHGEAKHVAISLLRDGETLSLEVADEGRGFDVDAHLSRDRAPSGGFGLTSMSERTEFSGGSFSVESTPGEGTRVTARWALGG